MILNFIGFNFCWFGLVILGNSFIPIAILLILAHLFIIIKSYSAKQAEIRLMLTIASLGVMLDSLLTYTSVFSFPNKAEGMLLPIPIWLITLWLCFSTTIAHGLKPLNHSYFLQALFGAVFAPMSYLAGAKLGAVNLGYSWSITYVILSVIWACLLVLFFRLKKHFFAGIANIENN